MDLAQDHVQWWTSVLAVMNLWVLLPEYDVENSIMEAA
jgi:hypothetical protein